MLILKVHDSFDGFKTPPLVREIKGFSDVGKGRVPTAHPLNWGLQV